jgi:hypothetical protein
MTNKHKELLLQQINEKDIIDDEMGNNRYVAITKDSVYFVSIGIQAGTFFGKKVKSFPIHQITSVDISKKVLASYMELTGAGFGGSSYTGAGYTAQNENLVFFPNAKMERFQEIAKKIRDIITKTSNNNSFQTNESNELEKFYELMKKGIITEEEFQKKKKQIIGEDFL